MSTIENFNVPLTKELATEIREAVNTGDYASPVEVMQEAMRDWQLKRNERKVKLERFEANVRALNEAAKASGLTEEQILAELEETRKQVFEEQYGIKPSS